MAITYGFYDSLNGDRRYTAQQFTELISSMITEGIFENAGDRFHVRRSLTATDGVRVGTGRCWFNGIWVKNDEEINLSLGSYNPSSGYSRIDAVYLYVDKANRTAGIASKAGTSTNANPERPVMSENELPLAFVHRTCDQSSGSVISLITETMGTPDCPYVTATLPFNNITNVVRGWNDEFYEWFQAVKDIYASDGGVPVPEVKVIKTTTSNVEHNKETVVATFTVPKGLWHLELSAVFSENNDTSEKGMRYIMASDGGVRFGLSVPVAFSDYRPALTVYSSAPKSTSLKISGYYGNSSTSAKTVAVKCYQNSGSTVPVVYCEGVLVKVSPSYTTIS